MKKVLLLMMALMLVVILVLTIGVQLAFATPEENGPVKFIGTIASDEQCDVFPVCYEECFCPVDLTQVIEDPYGLLEGVSSLEVCYGYEPMDLKEGETVEVYGYYWQGYCPMQYCRRVWVTSDPYYWVDYPYYIIRLPTPTPTPTPTLTPIVTPPPSIGGTIIPTDKLGLLMPWIMAAGALRVLAGVSLAIWSKRRGRERASGR
ncbi:MAG: hypothetical protein WBC82_00565 [Dehalococcoidia bacterium]